MVGESRRQVYEETTPVYEETTPAGVAPATTAPATTVDGVPATGVPVRPAPPAAATVEPVRRMHAAAVVNPGAGFGVGTIGILTVLLGAWAGIVPFVGPLFGFSATGRGAWVWDLPNALLWLVPGAVAVVLGLAMLSRAPGARFGLTTGAPMSAGFLVSCCGAWLAIGPFAWRVLEGGLPIRAAAPLHELAYWIGYSVGPGVLLAVLGGAAMGAALLTRRAVPAEALASTVTNVPMAA